MTCGADQTTTLANLPSLAFVVPDREILNLSIEL
jgi:hypothetical protein